MAKSHSSIYIIVLSLLVSTNIWCQSYSYNPGKLYVHTIDTNSNDFGGIEIVNIGTQNLDLNWRLQIVDTLIDSRFELCNSGICSLNLTHNGIMPTITPGNIGWIKFHMYSGVVTGTNTITYLLKNGSTTIDTLVFKIIVNTGVTGIKQLSNNKENVLMFPNPTKNNTTITLELVQNETVSISVVDVMGREVCTESMTEIAAGNHTVNLNTENWASGVYNVNISTANGKTSRKLVVSK